LANQSEDKTHPQASGNPWHIRREFLQDKILVLMFVDAIL
jgi:hypothetical protein